MTETGGTVRRQRGTGAQFAPLPAIPPDLCADCKEPAVVGLGAPPERLCMDHFTSRLAAISKTLRSQSGLADA